MSEKRKTSVANPRQGPNLRSLEFSPDKNPLMEPNQVAIKRRYVSTGRTGTFQDPETGELRAISVVRQIEDKDDIEFVKVFSDGIKAAYGLSRTASRVFQVVLDEYEKTPMNRGYADSVYLAWFGDGLSGRDVGMTDRTFQTGLREMLAKGFLAPRAPNLFWVNANLFFKGDRVMFIKEYRRKSIKAKVVEDQINQQQEIEK